MRKVGPAYWALCSVLIAFGILGAASIGLPFLLLGCLLVTLSGVRYQPARFWPPILALPAFFTPIVVFMPAVCHGSESADPNIGSKEWCTSLAGIEYAGPQGTGPTLLIGLGSLAFGVLVYLSASRALRNSVVS